MKEGNEMNAKKLLALLLAIAALLLVCGCAGAKKTGNTDPASVPSAVSPTPSASDGTPDTPAPFAGEAVRIALLSGSTGLGASKLIADALKGETVNDYTVTVTADPSEVIAGMKMDKYDLAALPVNVAAKLYNMADVDVQVVALNTLGVLYILENETDTIRSVADLKGKTLYTTGEGATPQYILEYVLQQNGLKAGEDVTVIYRATADEVQADAVASGSIVMLPEPKATVVSKAIATERYALDMTREWDKTSSFKLTQGCVVASRSFAGEHKQALDAFLTEYKASVEFVNKADDAAADAVVEAGIIGKAAIAKIAIPRSNLVCLEGVEMKEALSGTLSVLFSLDAKSVGGKLPEDDFYYSK